MNNNPRAFIRNISIFNELKDETINSIYCVGSMQTFSAGTVILQEDEVGSSLFCIIKGKVKIIRSDNSDKEIILDYLSESEVFGEMALLDGKTRSATVVAIEESELFILHRKDFIQYLKSYPEIGIYLMQELTSKLRKANLQIKSLSLNDAKGKVAVVLLQLAFDYGRIKQGIVEIDNVPIQAELAKMAGISRETFSRSLNYFIKNNLIEFNGQSIKIFDYEDLKKKYL